MTWRDATRRASRGIRGRVRYHRSMELDELQRNWDEFGKQDPLWAIRTEPDKRGGKWDLVEFFGSGEEHVRELVDRLDRARPADARRRARLRVWRRPPDAGVRRPLRRGVGHRHRAVDDRRRRGVQPSRVTRALRRQRHARTSVASTTRRSISSSRSSCCSTSVRTISLGYVREFFRICKPGGAVVFQIPSHMTCEPFPDGAYAAEITAEVPPRLPAGRTVAIPVHVRNAGTDGVAAAARPAPAREPLVRRPEPVRRVRQRPRADAGRGAPGSDGRPDPARARPDDAGRPRPRARPRARGCHVVRRARFADARGPGSRSSATARPVAAALFRRREAAGTDDRARRRARAGRAGADEPMMEMHAVHRDEVLALIARARRHGRRGRPQHQRAAVGELHVLRDEGRDALEERAVAVDQHRPRVLARRRIAGRPRRARRGARPTP